MQETAKRVLHYIAVESLTIKIGKIMALEEASLVHKWVESHQSTGKIVLKVAYYNRGIA
ncbi:hypothetical protein GCM10007096_36810 [Pullulanibacillus pueri]|uniref:Zinc-binding dehydrogenase n=1 Tax=Pullulanibacillus pueri TaxID=1437324 RepID=A0A8J3ENN4_9BACL|nr:hypothetical protein GCM10007096_36810 [Pullulanibacillus pueri]